MTQPQNVNCARCGKHLGVYVGEPFVAETVTLRVYCVPCDRKMQGSG
jgi:peptide methionine sulfoxide reductase MsrB